jgi:predicted porin
MKRSIVSFGLSVLAAAAAAQSTVNIAGNLRMGVVRVNDGSTPIDGNTAGAPANSWSMTDYSSALILSGKEDLGNGLHAGFELATFIGLDTGSSWADTGGPFWSRRAVVKFGGDFGEIYAGRSLTPAALMALFADPWYWDASAAQVGWQIHQANYTSTAYVRTNNTLGYVSPDWGGLKLTVAASPGEGVSSRDLGGSLTYTAGPLWLGAAYDQSHGFFNNASKDNMITLVGAYDFGVVRPMASYTASEVNGVDYKSYSLALTAPVGERGVVKAHYSHLDDVNTGTAAKEAVRKIGVGYQYSLSKRTNFFGQASHAKADTYTARNTFELGIEHGF